MLCHGTGSKSVRSGTFFTPPSPSANLPESTWFNTVSGWFRYAVGEITLAISSRFFGSRAIAAALSTERYNAAKVFGFCLMNSSLTPKAQHG